MGRVVVISRNRKVRPADIVVRKNGYELDEVWSEKTGLLFSHEEWRELFRLYSREVIRGKWQDYKIENDSKINWVYFSLISEQTKNNVSIGKHRVGNKFEYCLYERYNPVKKAGSLREIINHYETTLKT